MQMWHFLGQLLEWKNVASKQFEEVKKTFLKKIKIKKLKKTASNIVTIANQVQGERDMWREQPSVTVKSQIQIERLFLRNNTTFL